MRYYTMWWELLSTTNMIWYMTLKQSHWCEENQQVSKTCNMIKWGLLQMVYKIVV